MKISYIGIFHHRDPRDPAELVCERNLEGVNYFQKKTVSEFATLFSGRVAKRTKQGESLTVKDSDEDTKHIFYSLGCRDGLCGVVVADPEYPDRVARGLLRIVCDEFTQKFPPKTFVDAEPNQLRFPELQTYITKYQDPNQADSIMKIQNELDETKVIIHKSIESVLERGEKIDSLVAKSDTLSAQSKMFYTQAKKQNSCCVVM